MKVIDKIRQNATSYNVVFSFEFFPPKTEDGVDNLIDRIDRVVWLHNPSFCDITWRAGGSDLTLEIANQMQNIICVETMMHLTCTNMPVEKIDHALQTIKFNGIQNVLALRGDPPHGQDKFVQIEGGFSCALELVDAGADLIVTQLFYDTDIVLKFVNDCRQIGINCPFVPEIMPISYYKGFLRMTGICKTKIPAEVTATLEPIKDNEEAVKAYGIHLGNVLSIEALGQNVKRL